MFLKKIADDKAIVPVLLLLAGCIFLWSIIPPLQSPDEGSHIARAYLLGKGVFIQEQPAGMMSGGQIDSGLNEYMSHKWGRVKLSKEQIESADKIRWSGQHIYLPTPGTAYYFPLIYSPQATGLWVGKSLGFTVDSSYKLARVFSLLAVALLVYAAFRVYPANPLILALIAMPMSLFQFSSASLDGVATALAIFTIAIFLRITKDKQKSPNWRHYVLAIAVVLLATSRIHTAPMVLLLAASFLYTKNKVALYLFVVSVFLIIGWTAIALKTTVDLRGAISDPASKIAAFYLHHPMQLVSVLWKTVSDQNLWDFWYRSFLGTLGHLDAYFKNIIYSFMGICLTIIVALTVSFRNIKDEWPHRLLLVFIALTGIFLILFSLLVSWNPHPTNIILGVQGRYFLIPIILLAYSTAGHRDLLDGWRRKIATTLCLVFFIFSISATTNLLLQRYKQILAKPLESPPDLFTKISDKPTPRCTIDSIDGQPFSSDIKINTTNDILEIVGWSTPAAAIHAQSVQTYFVLQNASGTKYYMANPVVRPDVAAALGRPELESAGFNVTLYLGPKHGPSILRMYNVANGIIYRCPINITIP